MTPSITSEAINTAIAGLLTTMLPQLAGSVVVGQVNRVPDPEGDFIVFWPLRRSRLGTDLEEDGAALFTASIAATSMTVSALTSGTIEAGQTVFGNGVTANTIIGTQASGTPGGVGVYNISPSQTIGSETMLSGATTVMQPTEVVLQIDVHGPLSADNAQVISTLFRNDFALQQLAGSGLSPFFADDPRQMPFETAASQFEERWIVEAHLQVDPAVIIAQQLATSLTVGLYDVDYPPPS